THSAIRVVLGGVKVGSVDEDAGQRWYVATARAIVGLQAIEREQCGRPHETGHGVPIRLVRADTALGNTAEGEMSDITRDGAVIVILRDDNVSGLLPAELADLVDDSAQDLVVHFRRVDRVVCSRAIL